MEVNRLIKQSVAAAATLMLASVAHADIVTYEFTGSLTIGPMGDLAVPQSFSGHISFNDTVADTDLSPTHGQYVDRHPTAEFETRIGDQDFVVRGGGTGEVDVDIFNNDPSVGGGADGLGIFATDQVLSMGFFWFYDPSDIGDVFLNDWIPSTTPPLSGLGGFTIDEGNDISFSGWFDSFNCTTCAPVTSAPEPGMLTLSGAGLLMVGYAARRRKKVSKLASRM
jgi:hypothetical protein